MSETTAAGGQAIMAIVSLVGAQDTAVAAHRPGTDGAAVSVRIGRTLVYLGDQETAVHFRRVWETGLGQARTIPVHADPTRIMPIAGVAEPSLMLEAAGSPPAAVRLERPAGRGGHQEGARRHLSRRGDRRSGQEPGHLPALGFSAEAG